MGSTLTKEDLILRILRATQEVPESTLRLLPMRDLWMIERAITIDKGRESNGIAKTMKTRHHIGVFLYWRTQIGVGLALWETGAEIFLPYLMIKIMFFNKTIHKLLRLLIRWRIDPRIAPL